MFGFDHSEIGAALCESWKIPKKQIEAIRYHHFPSKISNNKLLHILHIADSLAIRSGFNFGIEQASTIDLNIVNRYQLKKDDILAIIRKVKDDVETIEDEMLTF